MECAVTSPATLWSFSSEAWAVSSIIHPLVGFGPRGRAVVHVHSAQPARAITAGALKPQAVHLAILGRRLGLGRLFLGLLGPLSLINGVNP